MKAIPEDASYQLQYRKCGKANCRACRDGTGHGKYWYAYATVNGKLKSFYVGSTLPFKRPRVQDWKRAIAYEIAHH